LFPELSDEARDDEENLLSERPLKRVRLETSEGQGYDVLVAFEGSVG